MGRKDLLNSLRYNENDSEELVSASLNNILKIYEHFSNKEIMESLKKLNDTLRLQLELKAATSGNLELSERIHTSIKNLETEQIEELRLATQEGKQEEFLSKLSWIEKTNLSVVIQSRNNILVGIDENFDKASSEDKILLNMLEKSINKDLLQIAKSEGFNNLEDWRANNGKKSGKSHFNGPSL